MSTMKIAKSAASGVSEITLKQAAARLLNFLTAVNGNAAIRSKLATKVKFTKARESEGWALLEPFRDASVASTPEPENPAVEGMAACEAWQSTGLAQVRAMLEMTSPDQALFLFHDLVPGKGMAAVFNLETFLERHDRLAHGPERKATRKADAEALRVIEEIGITKETLKEVEAMVTKAHSAPEPVNEAPAETEADVARLEALRKIHVWVTTWGEMARTVITRRDYLIQLGIAKRRPRAKAAVVAPPVVTPPAAPAADDNGPESRAA